MIDGGYTENSGLDTINSALTLAMPQIREHNAAQVAAGGPLELVMPVVVFLRNSVSAAAGADAAGPSETTEVIIPPLYGLSGAGALRATSKLLGQVAATSADWLPASIGGADVVAIRAAATEALAHQTMTVAPRQTAQMAQPLGWTLSLATRDSLDEAMDAYLECTVVCSASADFTGLVQGLGGDLTFPPPPD